MKHLALTALLFASTLTQVAHADVLRPEKANAICRKKALAAAHFIADSNEPFLVSYKASSIAEISTPITYEFTTKAAVKAGLTDSLYTVHAYAYPDDQSCLIGVITNNLAGND